MLRLFSLQRVVFLKQLDTGLLLVTGKKLTYECDDEFLFVWELLCIWGFFGC